MILFLRSSVPPLCGFSDFVDNWIAVSVSFLNHHGEFLIELKYFIACDHEVSEYAGNLYVEPAFKQLVQQYSELLLVKALIALS